MSRHCFALAFFMLALLVAVQVSHAVYVPPDQCDAKCAYRCSATSHRKPCMFFCNKCCVTCHCVPSGTYGNKDECPCYRDWKTKEGKPKCP